MTLHDFMQALLYFWGCFLLFLLGFGLPTLIMTCIAYWLWKVVESEPSR